MISGKARLAGVMGWPIGHSLSPRLHNHWLARAGVDGAYVPLAVRPEDLAEALRVLPRLGFRGVNVTIPHKERAFALVDEADAVAQRMRAVNTVLFDEDGRSLGRNTDGYGFLANLDDQAPGWARGWAGKGQGGLALIIGTGGAARAVVVSLAERGIARLRLVNRTIAKAERLADEVRAWGGTAVEVVPWEARGEALDGVALCINCTSLGMAGHPPLALDLARLPGDAVVVDIVYTPLETPLLAEARKRSLRAVDGLGMLLHQAVPGFRHWGGVEPEVDEATRQVMLEVLAVKR